MTKLRLAASAAVAAAMTVTLVACNDDASNPAASQAQSTQSAGGVATNADPKLALEAAVRKTDSRSSARVTLQVKSASVTMKGSGALKFTTPISGELAITGAAGSTGQQDVTIRLMPDAMYFSSPAMTAQMQGKKWFKLSYADLKTTAGSQLGKLFEQQLGAAQDPREALKPLLASKDLKKVGTETIDGAQTTQYHGTIDVAQALASSEFAKVTTAEERQKLRQQLTETKMRQLATDVWVDGAGWPRRIVQHAKTAAGDVATTIDFSDFGTAVDVKAPPAAEVQDFGAMLQQLGTLGQS